MYHKFGVQVPGSLKEALQNDKETNTNIWFDVMQKELKNVKIALKFMDPESKAPIGYEWIKGHMVFDVKMDFTHKAHYIAGGHLTDPPMSLT